MGKWFVDNQGNPYHGDRQGFDEGIQPRPEDGKAYAWNNSTKAWEEINVPATTTLTISVTADQVKALDDATSVDELRTAVKSLLGMG